jgi:hypothetical protein
VAAKAQKIMALQAEVAAERHARILVHLPLVAQALLDKDLQAAQAVPLDQVMVVVVVAQVA